MPWTINEPHLPKLGLCWYYVTVQDTFQSIPGLISCAGVTGRWGLLFHAQNVVRWLALSKRSVQQIAKLLQQASQTVENHNHLPHMNLIISPYSTLDLGIKGTCKRNHAWRGFKSSQKANLKASVYTVKETAFSVNLNCIWACTSLISRPLVWVWEWDLNQDLLLTTWTQINQSSVKFWVRYHLGKAMQLRQLLSVSFKVCKQTNKQKLCDYVSSILSNIVIHINRLPLSRNLENSLLCLVSI